MTILFCLRRTVSQGELFRKKSYTGHDDDKIKQNVLLIIKQLYIYEKKIWYNGYTRFEYSIKTRV